MCGDSLFVGFFLYGGALLRNLQASAVSEERGKVHQPVTVKDSFRWVDIMWVPSYKRLV